MTAVNLNSEEPWSPTRVDPNEPVRHIVEGMARPGEEATALCGVRWKVQQVHSVGAGDSTCEGCVTIMLRRGVHR